MEGDTIITKESILTFRQSSRVIIRDAAFIYVLPHPGLRSWISNYTITFPNAGMMSDQYAVLPHGSATLVFSCDSRSIGSDLFGPITQSTRVGSTANLFDMLLIVEFQPAGYYAFSEIPQKELTDTVVPFDAINPTLQKLIAQQVETVPTVESLIAEVDRLFLAHLKTAFYQQEFSLVHQMIISSGGRLSVKEASQSVFYSERHLSRMFDKYMGLGVKSFSSLVRMNKALHLLRKPTVSVLQAAMQAGFYDVPHFIHAFKAACGITPQEYKSNMSDFYSEIAKF